MARGYLAVLLFLGGFFWVGGIAQVSLLVLAGILAFTALSGFCPLYLPFGVSTFRRGVTPRVPLLIALMALLALLLGGSFGSDFFTKKFFLEDYNAMNGYYKQTLFYTGQENRVDANEQYTKLVPAYDAFLSKYTTYHPFAFRADKELDTDLVRIAVMIALVEEDVKSGDLKAAHVALEGVRPIFQDILKRNDFSLLAVTLVDFHDAMEVIIARADAKDASGVVASYEMVSEKLKAVEAEANDAEIHAIRTQLEALLTLGNAGDAEGLSAAAAALKSSFVKVYLKRG